MEFFLLPQVSSSGSALLGAVSQHISADSQGGRVVGVVGWCWTRWSLDPQEALKITYQGDQIWGWWVVDVFSCDTKTSCNTQIVWKQQSHSKLEDGGGVLRLSLFLFVETTSLLRLVWNQNSYDCIVKRQYKGINLNLLPFYLWIWSQRLHFWRLDPFRKGSEIPN